MKKFILAAMAALMIFGLQAQDTKHQKGHQAMTPEKMAQFETDRMVKELKLDKATEEKINEINLRYAKQQSEMRMSRQKDNQKMKDENRQAMRKQMEEMQANKDKEFEKVLSKKDFASYKEKREQMRKRMMERRNNAEQSDDYGRNRTNGENPTQD